jgi:putative transposase
MQLQLTEQHIIKTDEWKDWCVKAKNLYNQSLYYWRQSVFGNIQYFTEFELLGLFREYNEENFIQLPSHCGQEIIKNLFKNIKSWHRARKSYNKDPNKFSGKPRMPKYKKDLSIIGFNNGQIKWKSGYIHFPKMIGIPPIKTNIYKEYKLGACRVIPKSNHFVVEFTYTIPDVVQKEYNGKALGIDLGVNNICSCISNTGNSYIINGKPLKSINAFYNKRLGKLQKQLKSDIFTSKRIERLAFKRNNLIKNYIHHTSKYIIKNAEELDITKIIIGNNKNWKREINIGKRNNQNFVSIPHSQLIKQIEYKAMKIGIEVINIEESYTSKCSAMDLEPICKHEIYVGNRVKRGLFKTANGTKINADVNGAINILRKVIGDFEINDSIWSAVIAPVKRRNFEQKIA